MDWVYYIQKIKQNEQLIYCRFVLFQFLVKFQQQKNDRLVQTLIYILYPKMKPTRKIKNNVPRYNGSLFKKADFLALKFAFEVVTSRIWKSTVPVSTIYIFYEL